MDNDAEIHKRKKDHCENISIATATENPIDDQIDITDDKFSETSTQTTNIKMDTKSTQAAPPSMVCAHIENVILKNELTKSETVRNLTFSYETCSQDVEQFKFFTGLHVLHFQTLLTFLGDITSKLSYWRKSRKNEIVTPTKRSGPPRKLSAVNQLFLTLIKLRRGYCNRDLAYRFDISESYVSVIIITWIQLLFHEMQSLKESMFPNRQKMKPRLAGCFKPFKNIRVIVDCTEFFVNTPKNLAKQVNLYSHYKHHHTFKVLVGLSPTGALCFLSEGFEGAKSDKEVFLESGIMDCLNTGDLVMADRGFTIDSELSEIGVKLNIPPFLHGREKLTPEEEVKTKQIAKCRIHVERIIERIKKYRILKGVLPHSLGPLFSQIVFVVGCLVNFEKPIC